MKACSAAAINTWEWITDNRIQFIWGSGLRLHIESAGRQQRHKNKNLSNSVKPFSGMFATEDRHSPAKIRWALGYTFIRYMYFSSCVKMELIYWKARITLYWSSYCILQCNALFFSIEHIAWQQEEAPCGGPFMSEAIIFEWTSAPIQQSTNILSVERKMLKRLKHSTVHGRMSALFL